jgi:ABC-2 type transport system permease protein
MRGSVFFETLRQTWLQAIYWGVGLGLISLFMILIVPNADALNQMVELLKTMPPFLLQAAGVGDDLNFLATPDGFVAVGFFGKMLLLIAAYPIVMGLRVTINEEDSGSLDMLLSLPVPRWRVVLEKFAAYTLTIFVIVVLSFIGIWAGRVMSGIEINLGRVAETILNLTPSLILILAATVFIGTVIRRRKIALGVATAFIIGSFMLDTIGAIAKGTIAENLRALSFFKYFDGAGVMQNGLEWANVMLPLVVAVVLLVGSLWAFQRRDVGV